MLRLAWPRAVRALLVGALVLVVAVILGYFASHRRPPSVVPAATSDIPAEQVEKQEGVEHVEFRGDRTIHIKAGSWHKGEDGRFYLEKDVEVRDLAKQGGREIYLAGDKVVYDKDWTEARLEGRAKIRVDDMQFESSDFDYRQAADALSAEHGVVISSPKLSGAASRMTYAVKDEIIRLEGEVSLEGSGRTGDSGPFTIQADVLTYRRLERKGHGEGGVGFSLGRSRGRAETIDFRMTDDEQFLLNFSMRGGAQFSLAGDEPSEGGGPAGRRGQEIQAVEMDGRAFLNLDKLHSLEARGGCSLDSFTSDGRPISVRSGEMLFVFDRWGGLREHRAWGRASLVESGEGGRVERTVAGNNLVIEGPGELLRVTAEEGGEARLDSTELEITARAIELVPRSEDVFAEGSVTLLLRPRGEAGAEVGFFSGGQSVLAVGGTLRYEKGNERLILSEGARMWQGKQMLSGKELSARRDTGELQGTGEVQAVFPRASKKEGEPEQRLEVGGNSLTFDPKGRLLTYRSKCWLKTQNASLTSDRIDVFLSGEDNAVSTIEAEGSVIIVSGFREGRGNTALYDLNKETIDLTGNPSVTDKEKGVIEGDRLTFHLGDGRVHVENSGRERSVTVIKS